jgi:hypothetical protein
VETVMKRIDHGNDAVRSAKALAGVICLTLAAPVGTGILAAVGLLVRRGGLGAWYDDPLLGLVMLCVLVPALCALLAAAIAFLHAPVKAYARSAR